MIFSISKQKFFNISYCTNVAKLYLKYKILFIKKSLITFLTWNSYIWNGDIIVLHG